MEIGKLDQRISLQRKSLADDGAGGATATWSTYATVWADVRPLTGRERENAMRNEATANYLVKIRYLAGVVDHDRILWGDRYLNIRFPRYRGSQEMYLEIEAELGAPN